ncbi:MAG: hypothetical protein U1F43_38000 [Myxococcota bacterium]
MKLIGTLMAAAGAAALGGACSQGGAPGDNGHPLAVTVAPLDLPQMTDACYGLTVYNTTDPSQFGPDTQVWTQPSLCASQYGAEGGIRFTGICDAAVGDNSVRLVLNDVYRNGTVDSGTALTAGADYINPCPAPTNPGDDNGCILTAPCQANQDSKVVFNLEVMRQAELGFFDTVVKFQDVFCAAKLDCEDEQHAALDYLYDASATPPGDGPTAVLAFTCLGGSGGDVFMYLDDITVSCSDGSTATVDPSAGPGNVTPVQSGPTRPLFGAAINTGAGFQGAQYWNVLLGMSLDAASGACTVHTRGTVSEVALTGNATPDHTRYPFIDWTVPLSDGATRSCHQHPLNGGNGVGTIYTSIDSPETFDRKLTLAAACPCWDSAAIQAQVDAMVASGPGNYQTSFNDGTSDDGTSRYASASFAQSGDPGINLYLNVYDSPTFHYCAFYPDNVSRSDLTPAEVAACLADVAQLKDDPCQADNGGCGSDVCIFDAPGVAHCIGCRTTADCAPGNYCTSENLCTAGECGSDGDCSSAAIAHCDLASHTCACTDDRDLDGTRESGCGIGSTCSTENNTHECVAGCATNDDCSPFTDEHGANVQTEECNPSTHQCQAIPCPCWTSASLAAAGATGCSASSSPYPSGGASLSVGSADATDSFPIGGNVRECRIWDGSGGLSVYASISGAQAEQCVNDIAAACQ